MKLDKTFAREISKISNGDGSREAKFAFKKTVQEVKRALSTPEVREKFTEYMKQYGRVPVAICTAATIIDRRDRLEWDSYLWALEVMKLYTNAPGDKGFAIIEDGLHPTRIEEYAGSFIRLTTEEK